MGIGNDDLKIIIKLKEKGYLPRNIKIAEIGSQQLANCVLTERELLNKLIKLHDKNPRDFNYLRPIETWLTEGGQHLSAEAPYAKELWQRLGYEYLAIDIDNAEDSLPLDLNFDSVPWRYRKKYFLVTNFGTTEHVANQLNAFKIIHDLTQKGGVMMHNVPCIGMMNHGLVNYNLKFFWMLARSNGYNWVYSDIQVNDEAHAIPKNILDDINQFNIRSPVSNIVDGTIKVVMQKKYDIKFVPPLDINTGATAPNKKISKRYWTIFDNSAFE